ncbi:DEAD/DEAH box helicase family protein [Streptomyces sp. NPDC058914]|uniref:DEAD/DEAH box helicase family protein n=1 Tax=Streptomyces sp. NPDC058914 TaxID=3346671 RepID=UPI0036BFDBD8
MAAIEVLLRLREDQTDPTAEDLAALRNWPGWGPLAPALAPDREGTWAEIGEQLQRLLSPREYRQAEQGTSTAYYTPSRVADACWSALSGLGFTGGRVLEPGCGAGTFINHTPAGLDVDWFGVERDPTTAGIAALLHPDAEIVNARLQDAALRSNSVDAVLGNVPYGNFPVHDPTAPKSVRDSIHNYFIWRSVQALRPGGVAILLTSRYTMDSEDDTARRAIAQHADLLGAIRLPNGALAEGGTGVLADILVLRRRDDDRPVDDSWMETSSIPDVPNQSCNDYFLRHREHVLGTFAEGRAPRYGHTLEVKALEGQDLGAALGEAFGSITAAASANGREWSVASGAEVWSADNLPFPVREDGRKEGSFHLVDGTPYEVIDGELVAVERAGKELPKLIRLRDATLKLLEAEADHDTPDAQLEPLRAEVNRLYDVYVKAHGPVNRYTLVEGQVDEETGLPTVSRRHPRMGGFRRDPDFVTVLALEDFDDETQTARKAALLTRRVNKRIERPTTAESPEEALSLSLNYTNRVDVPFVAQLLGIGEDQVAETLGDLVFTDPDSGDLLTAGEYLSGPVVEKLERAEFHVSQGREELARNVTALREVQPEPLPPEEIRAKLGAPWIPVEDVADFAEEVLGVRVDITHIAKTATWSVDQPMTVPEAATSEWGTSRVSGFELLDLALNGQAPVVHDEYRLPDGGRRRVRNDKETLLAETKLTDLARRFSSWVWEDPGRADRLAADYNRRFNSTVLRKNDGSHLTIDGLDPEFTPYEHQWDFVQRVLSAEEGSLCPYPVGAGKTATMFMTAIKLKQLGIVNKPLIVVPNHLLEQIARDGKRIFPNANILMAGKKDLADQRARMLFAARVATGDWDAVVMTHNSFGRLGVHPVTEAEYLERLAAEYREALGAVDEEGQSRRIKEIAKHVDRFDARASDLRSKATDAGVTYENLGIDFLQIDEMHYFKNLALPATTEGMALGKPSKRATHLDLVIQITRERTGRDNVVAGYTGTPISNSVRELYVFQHYLMPKRLEKIGLGSPDAWAANFILFESRPEVGVDGVSFRLKRRPVEYTNADDALGLFQEIAELRPRDAFKIERPKRVDKTVVIDPTPNLVSYVSTISDRIDLIQQGKVKPYEDNMLNVITDGRKAALDLELVGLEPDGPGKAGAIAENVLEVYHRTKDLKLPGDPDDVAGGFQIVFCDLGTPSKERGSQVYGKIRTQLIDGGIPRDRIRFIHDYNSDLAKAQLFADCRAGKVSVLFASTEKAGVGTNVQTRAVALHHADPPHKPAEWEQREGRVDRPGNLIIKAGMPAEYYRYIAEHSFDSFMFQQLERKQRPIVQIMSGRKVGRVLEEIDPVGASFAQAKAVATGNPLLLELAEATAELTKLHNLADGHRQAQARMRRKVEVLEDTIRDGEASFVGAQALADAVAAAPDEVWRTADGRPVKEEDVPAALVRAAQGASPNLDLDAGFTWRGLNVGFTFHRRQWGRDIAYESWAHLVADGHQRDVRVNLSLFGKGQGWRLVKAISDAVDDLPSAPAELQRKVETARAQLEDTRSHIGRPFDRHADLEAARERKAALETAIRENAAATDREKNAGPAFVPGGTGPREMTEAEMAMHDAAAMVGMMGGSAVIVSEGQFIDGAQLVDGSAAADNARTPGLTDPRQWDEAVQAFATAAAADGDVTAWAQVDANKGERFRDAFAEWAQEWALDLANRPEDRPAWLRAWLDPEGADTRRSLIAEAAGIVWRQARATQTSPATPDDEPPAQPTAAPASTETAPRAPEEPAPAPDTEGTGPESRPQPERQDAPALSPEPSPNPTPTPASAPAAEPEAATPAPASPSTDTPEVPASGQTSPMQDLIDGLGDRVMVGHIGGPAPAPTHQSAGWAITAALSEDQVKGLVSACAVDGQPVSTVPGYSPTDRVREWIAEQQQTPTSIFYASTSSDLPSALRGNGDVRLWTRADGLALEQGDVSTTILWEELPAWVDAAVAYNTANRDPFKPWWRHGRLDHEIHFVREGTGAFRTALAALDTALREMAPPSDERLEAARDRYGPRPAPPTEPESTDIVDTPETSGQQLPEDANPVPGTGDYFFTQEGRTAQLYTAVGEHVGTAQWSYTKYRYEGDVQGDVVRGTEDVETVVKRMAHHYAAVYGGSVHRPQVDDQGRDPVWILHNGHDTLVFGVSPEDNTARAAMWTGGGFKESRKVGGWYLPRTWKEPTRRERVDTAVRVLAAAGRTVLVHAAREERQRPQEPDRLPILDVVRPNVDEVPQLFSTEPYSNDDEMRADFERLTSAYERWEQLPTVRAYINQDNDARPDGFGAPENPIAELRAAYRWTEGTLRHGSATAGPEEVVRRIHAVAAWCMALEPAVEEDLLDPLQDVHEAAHGLAARAQATIVAFDAEVAAPAEQGTAPADGETLQEAPAPKEAAAPPAPPEQAPAADDQVGAPAGAEATAPTTPESPITLATPPTSSRDEPEPLQQSEQRFGGPERLAQYAERADVAPTSASSSTVWLDGRLIGYVADLNQTVGAAHDESWPAELRRPPGPRFESRPVFGHRDAVSALLEDRQAAVAELVARALQVPVPREAIDENTAWTLSVTLGTIRLFPAYAGDDREAAERLSALQQVVENLSAGQLTSADLAEDLALAHDELLWAADLANTSGPYMVKAAEELAVLLAATRPDDPRAWRPDPSATADTVTPADVEQSTQAPAPDRPTRRTRTQGGGSAAARSAESEQLGLFGDPTPDTTNGQAEPDAAPPAAADNEEAAPDDAVRVQLAMTEVTGAAGIRYSLFGSLTRGEPETIEFHVVRVLRGVTGTVDFSGTRDECLAYIESEAAVRSAAEAVDENSEQQAAALAWLREHQAPAAPAASEEMALPALDVVLLDVDVPPLDPAEPYTTDAEAQADIDRLGAAFARWDALPSVQRYYEADRQQRPNGSGDPTNPLVQLTEGYRDAERTLREGPVGSPDDLVRQVHTVAAWSEALEAVVGEDLRGPLREVREAASLLASRSQATVEAFEAELEALPDSQVAAGAEGTQVAATDAEPTEQAAADKTTGGRVSPEQIPEQPATDTSPAVEPPPPAPETAPQEPDTPEPAAEQLFKAGDWVYHDGARYPVSEVSEDGTVLHTRIGTELPAAEVTREQDMPPVTSERLADGWWRYSYRDRTYTVARLPDELARGRLATLSFIIVDESNDLVGRSFGTPTDDTIIWGYHHPGVLDSSVTGWWQVGGDGGPLPEYTTAEQAYLEAGPPLAQMSFDLDAAAETMVATDVAVPEPASAQESAAADDIDAPATEQTSTPAEEPSPPEGEASGQQSPGPGTPAETDAAAAAVTDTAPTGEDSPSEETAQDAPEEPTMTPPTSETTEAPSEPPIEEPPAPQRYFETVPLAGDAGYRLRLSGLDGQPVDFGEVLQADLVVATVQPGAEGGWFARLATAGLPAEVSYLADSPQDAAAHGAVMYAAFTGTPYGPPPGAATGDETRQRVDVLRANLRDAALQHRDAVSGAAARAFPDYEQNAHFQELVGSLDGLAAAVSDSHGSQQMTQHLDAVQAAVNGWGGSLPPDPGHPVRRQLAFPLAQLLYDSQRLRQHLQATLDAVQAERAASREQAATVESPAQPDDVPGTTAEPRQDGTESGSPALPDSQTPEVAQGAPAAPPASTPTGPDVAEPVSAPPSGRDTVRQETRQSEKAAPAPAWEPGGLPLWTGPDAPPADTAATESATGPIDVRAEFQAVMEAWQEHVPSESGTAQDLVADLDADLTALQRLFADAVTPSPAAQEPPAATAAAPAPAPAADGATAPTAGAPTPSSPQDAQHRAAAVTAALQRADAHADVLEDLPEWQKIQTVRGAFGHLFRVMKERARECFDRLMGDHRVGDFFRKISIRACEKVAGWAQAGADRLRRGGTPGADAPGAHVLRDLGDVAAAYSAPGGDRSGPPPASPNGPTTTVDIPPMRKIGEALSRPMPGAADGRGPRVSTAAARGRSTTRRGTGTKKPGGGEQAGHLRHGGSEQQQGHKPTQR